MSWAQVQRDLFRRIAEPALDVARANPANHRMLLDDDCHWEQHNLDDKMYVAIGVGRAAAGFYATYKYRCRWGGAGGSVFAGGVVYDTFSQAREAAIERLIRQLEVNYDRLAAKDRLALAALARAAA